MRASRAFAPILVVMPEAVLRLFLLEGPSPGVAGLKAALPELVCTPLGVDIPLRDRGPEEILALCLRFGVTARATRIVERADPVDGAFGGDLVSALQTQERRVLKLAVINDVFSRIAEFFGTSRGAVVEKLINVAAIWIAAWLSYQLVKRIARRVLSHMNRHHADATTAAEKRGQTIAEVVRSVGRLIILVLAILLTAAQFIPIAPLIAAGGILGLAVSFGSQSLVKDVLAGFFFLFENQFALGDVIEAGGKSGTVERMTLRVVMLRDVGGVLHVVPNGQITTVSNLTRSWSRAMVEVGVAYAADLDRALEVFRDEVTRLVQDPAWNGRLEGATEVGVEDLSEHAVMVRTMLRTVPGAQWDVAREFRRRIKNRLDAEGIPIFSLPRAGALQAGSSAPPAPPDSQGLPGS